MTRVATLGLSATATGGQQAQPAVLSIGAVSFPATTIGSTSSVVTATVTNTGGSAGVISSRTLTTGTNFAITGGTCTTSSSVAVSGTCTVTMTFSPTGEAGTKNDTLNVGYNDGTAAQTATLAISGTANAQQSTAAVLAIGSVSFPSTVVGNTSAPVTATVTNTGNATGTITSRALVTGTQFAITGGTCTASSTVAASGTCTVIMTFSPTGNAGTRTDTLNVVYNNGTTSQTATLAISATADPVPQQGAGVLTAVWANDGGDKVAREERRASINAASVVNTVWDGAKIKLFGAKTKCSVSTLHLRRVQLRPQTLQSHSIR